jgi:hypothetical protein
LRQDGHRDGEHEHAEDTRRMRRSSEQRGPSAQGLGQVRAASSSPPVPSLAVEAPATSWPTPTVGSGSAPSRARTRQTSGPTSTTGLDGPCGPGPAVTDCAR